MKYQSGMAFKIDNDSVRYFREIVCMNGEVRHQFSTDLLLGYPSHELKNSQLREMLACGRVTTPNKACS